MKEYYKILRVPFWASDDEVKKAYRSLVHEYHPDKNSNSIEAEEKIKEINEAYNVLGNAERRKEYDFNCIISNKYASQQPDAAVATNGNRTNDTQKDTGFDNNNKSQSSPRKERNFYDKWKKVLWVALPVLATLVIVYLLLPATTPSSANTVDYNKPAADTALAGLPQGYPVEKTFAASCHVRLNIKWENGKVLCKLDLQIPVSKGKPTAQLTRVLGREPRLALFDAEGFIIAELPISRQQIQGGWKKNEKEYRLSINSEAVLEYAAYATLKDWKMGSGAIELNGENTAITPLKTKKGANVNIRKKQPFSKPLMPSPNGDILNDETIRSGFKKGGKKH